ncbi:hypothetical protein Tco_0992936 [Tanacetum coccineum]|uniref:Uncharacterized protein n=1 Tax=Tanacetum coccineum TaxID=301880 RepID=A0ABQ5F5A0_9ASTR
MFHAVINRTNVDYVVLLWWDFMNNMNQKKEVVQYPRFIKLIIADLMKKFPEIPQRIEEDYHSIKDDISCPCTDDFKEYETVFMNVDVPMNQPQPVYPTISTSTAGYSSADIQHQLYLNMKSKTQDQAADLDI